MIDNNKRESNDDRMQNSDKTSQFSNKNLKDIITPVKVDLLEKMLIDSNYHEKETSYLVDGFRNGFSIEYKGPENRRDYSDNIPFRSVGSSKELWEKLMKSSS